MLKTSLLVLGGLVAGLAIAFWIQPAREPLAAIAASEVAPANAVRSAQDDRAADRLAAL